MNKLLLILCSATLLLCACKIEPPIQKYIDMEKSMNANMPQNLSPRLRLDKVAAVSKYKFKYFYTLLNDPDISAGTFIDRSKPQIINSMKGLADTQKFKADGMTIIYSYSRNDGSTFAEIAISPDEY